MSRAAGGHRQERRGACGGVVERLLSVLLSNEAANPSPLLSQTLEPLPLCRGWTSLHILKVRARRTWARYGSLDHTVR